MGSTYKFRKEALKKLKPYEGTILTAREILKITGFSKNTYIRDCWIGRHCDITLIEQFGVHSKDNKYKINEIDIEKYHIPDNEHFIEFKKVYKKMYGKEIEI